MDKVTWDALKAILRPYFRDGGTYANAVEAVRSAELDVEEERRAAEGGTDTLEES